MMGPRPLLLATALALGALLFSGPAHAYCRASTCETGVLCDPATDTDCGRPLFWDRVCVGVSVQKSGSNQISSKDAKTLLLAAFAAWESTDCGGGARPGIQIEDLGSVSCERVEYNSKAGNANTLVFRDEEWPHISGPHNIALTTVTFDTKTGEIFDADIEVNSANYVLTTGDPTADYDLLSVLTHEAGHFLGLAHSVSTDATMFAVYSPGTTEFRSLAFDDQNGICNTYPPAKGGTCNPLPRHGFAAECAGEQYVSDCSTHPGPRGSVGGAVVLFGLVLGGGCAFRRRRRAPSS